MNFKDKVVVITGGSQGFGKSLAEAIKGAGANVIISSEDSEQLSATASELEVDKIVADVSVIDDIQSLATSVVKKYGKIDIWINNAGIQIAPSNIEAVDVGKLHRLFAVNFFGYFYGMQVALSIMREQGTGIIVNINSTAGLEGKPGISAYVASKFAIKGLTQSAREELKDTNIKVFGIHPGGMKTDIYKESYPSDFDSYMSVNYAVRKIMDNFDAKDPELDLVIRRPTN